MEVGGQVGPVAGVPAITEGTRSSKVGRESTVTVLTGTKKEDTIVHNPTD